MNEEEKVVEEQKVETVETEETTETKEKDKFYRIEEMYDEMAQSLHNIATVIEHQKYLIDKLTEMNDEKFAILIKQLSDQLTHYQSQLPILEQRAHQLFNVIEKCKQQEEIKEAILMFVEALNMFNS